MTEKRLKIEDLLDRLKTWAVAAGAESETLTNPYELLRLRVKGGVAIIYQKANGKQTWNPLSQQLREAMEGGQAFPDSLRIVNKTPPASKRSVTHRTLVERDGDGCFFCFDEKDGQMTIEHLVPRAHGGPNHISNKFRACQPCNGDAGHKSAPEKIRIREANLLARFADNEIAPCVSA